MKAPVFALVVGVLCAVVAVEAAPLAAQRAQTVDISDAGAKALQTKPAAAASVMVANGKLRARPGYTLYVGDGGNVGVVVKDEGGSEPGTYAAETVLIRDWRFPSGRYLVWVSCSCHGQSDDNCAFARDGSRNINVNECHGSDCCDLTTLLLNDSTGEWQSF